MCITATAAPRSLRSSPRTTGADDAVIGASPAGVITEWNRGAERLYGYTAEEAVGYADVSGFSAETGGTVQTTGTGKVLGISPQYRGSSCNFWALYDNNPHLVGATMNPGPSLLVVLGVSFLGEALVVGTRAARTGLPHFEIETGPYRNAALQGCGHEFLLLDAGVR